MCDAHLSILHVKPPDSRRRYMKHDTWQRRPQMPPIRDTPGSGRVVRRSSRKPFRATFCLARSVYLSKSPDRLGWVVRRSWRTSRPINLLRHRLRRSNIRFIELVFYENKCRANKKFCASRKEIQSQTRCTKNFEVIIVLRNSSRTSFDSFNGLPRCTNEMYKKREGEMQIIISNYRDIQIALSEEGEATTWSNLIKRRISREAAVWKNANRVAHAKSHLV